VVWLEVMWWGRRGRDIRFLWTKVFLMGVLGFFFFFVTI
jgi:hypothetical protein